MWVGIPRNACDSKVWASFWGFFPKRFDIRPTVLEKVTAGPTSGNRRIASGLPYYFDIRMTVSMKSVVCPGLQDVGPTRLRANEELFTGEEREQSVGYTDEMIRASSNVQHARTRTPSSTE